MAIIDNCHNLKMLRLISADQPNTLTQVACAKINVAIFLIRIHEKPTCPRKLMHAY